MSFGTQSSEKRDTNGEKGNMFKIIEKCLRSETLSSRGCPGGGAERGALNKNIS